MDRTEDRQFAIGRREEPARQRQLRPHAAGVGRRVLHRLYRLGRLRDEDGRRVLETLRVRFEHQALLEPVVRLVRRAAHAALRLAAGAVGRRMGRRRPDELSHVFLLCGQILISMRRRGRGRAELWVQQEAHEFPFGRRNRCARAGCAIVRSAAGACN